MVDQQYWYSKYYSTSRRRAQPWLTSTVHYVAPQKKLYFSNKSNICKFCEFNQMRGWFPLLHVPFLRLLPITCMCCWSCNKFWWKPLISHLANRQGDPLEVSGLESILVAQRSSWTGSSGYTQAYGIRQQTASIFSNMSSITVNLVNSIKCVGDSCSYLSYACSLLCAPGMIHTCAMWPTSNLWLCSV